jgi:hypothetical protein
VGHCFLNLGFIAYLQITPAIRPSKAPVSIISAVEAVCKKWVILYFLSPLRGSGFGLGVVPYYPVVNSFMRFDNIIFSYCASYVNFHPSNCAITLFISSTCFTAGIDVWV